MSAMKVESLAAGIKSTESVPQVIDSTLITTQQMEMSGNVSIDGPADVKSVVKSFRDVATQTDYLTDILTLLHKPPKVCSIFSN